MTIEPPPSDLPPAAPARFGLAGRDLRVATVVPEAEAALAELLARAFRDNPLNRAVIRADPQRRLRSNLHGMRMLLSHALERAKVLTALAPGAGSRPLAGLIGLPPFAWPLPPPPLLQQLRAVLGQGLGAAHRWGRVFRQLEEIHPIEPHWYLAVLGVEPEWQARGIGSALLAHWLEQVDRDRAPAYLETDREESVGFYERAGFRTLESLALLGVPIWRMWREPSAGRSNAAAGSIC